MLTKRCDCDSAALNTHHGPKISPWKHQLRINAGRVAPVPRVSEKMQTEDFFSMVCANRILPNLNFGF